MMRETRIVNASEGRKNDSAELARLDALMRREWEAYRTVEIHHRSRLIFCNEHPWRVACEAMKLGFELGYPCLEELGFMSLFHDVGKADEDTFPFLQLTVGKKYTDKQRAMVRDGHTRLGPKVLDLIAQFKGFGDRVSILPSMKEVCLFHHPEADESRLSRPPYVKIVAIVDKFDGMLKGEGEDERSHQPRHSLNEVIQTNWVRARRGILDSSMTRVYIERCLNAELPVVQ